MFLIVYEVTIQNTCPQWPLSESVHTWPRLTMNCRNLSKVPGQLLMFWQAKKKVSVKCFLLFIKSQFTTNTPKILCLNRVTDGHVWANTGASFYRPGAFERRLTDTELCWGNVYLFFNTVEWTTVWSVPTGTKLKDGGRVSVGAVPRILYVCGHILI